MKKGILVVSVIVIIIFLSAFSGLIHANSGIYEARFIHVTKNGPILFHEYGLQGTGTSTISENPYVVWSHNLTDAIYNTTSNTANGYVFAGTYLNPPKEAELFSLGGGGIPEWGYGGTRFYTDAGDTGFTLAGVDEDSIGVNAIKWTGPGSGTPDWTTSFSGYGITSYGPIAVSDDGSTIAIIAAPSGTDAHLLLFDAGSSTPIDNYVASGLGFPRYVKINADGRYTAFIASATIVVYDRDLVGVRSQISMGFSNSGLDISGDGDLVAYGWPSLRLTEWNGTSYQEKWNWSPGGTYYVGRIAVSTDGSTIVSCWNTSSFNTMKVVVHDTSSSTPLWSYDYPVSSGVYQEATGDVDITDDGRYFIVGSLGDIDNINPEVHIFQRDSTPYIYYTADMPGSVFSVDIKKYGRYATACGKHVHANQMGRGGDIILIDTDITAVSENDFTDHTSKSVCILTHPNPFTSEVRIQISGVRKQKSENRGQNSLQIYDVSGRKVREISVHSSQFSVLSYSWDGQDEEGIVVSPGIYFLKFNTGDYTETKKLIKIH